VQAGTPRLYFETIRRLRAEQVVYQLRRRLGTLRPAPRADSAPAALAPREGWGPRVPRCRTAPETDVLAGSFRFWGTERHLDLEAPWLAPDLGASWNYPLHYFDALPALADLAREDGPSLRTLCTFVGRWIEHHPPGKGIGWEPYPTALRLVNWIDALAILGPAAEPGWRERLLRSIHVQAQWLSRSLERHLLGTHVLKDVKALLVTASLFDDAAARRWRREATPLLRRELRHHVGAEGGHLEPSLMYHCTALEDVLDLLNFAGALDVATAAEVQNVASRMLAFATATAMPSGEVPLLGDAWIGGAPSPVELSAYAARLGLEAPIPLPGPLLLSEAGLLVWRDGRLVALADVGGVGPPHLSGHGHCDSLSFELWCDGAPFVVDSGTFTYEPGTARQACRTTGAHNTIQIDGKEQHEIWAAFRVARRSEVRVVSSTNSSLAAELVPWFDKRLRVQRRFEWEEGLLRIVDRVEGPGAHRVVSRLHLHPDCQVQTTAEGWILVHGDARVELSWPRGAPLQPRQEPQLLSPESSGSHFAARAGELQANALLQHVYEGTLPFTSVLTLRCRDPL